MSVRFLIMKIGGVQYRQGIAPSNATLRILKDIRAEILGLMSHDDYMVDGFNVLDIIDKHIKG